MTEQFISFFNNNFRFNFNTRTKSYGVFSNRSNKYVDPSTIFTQYSQAMSTIGVSAGVTMEEVSSYISENMPKDTKEERLPPSEFLKQWLKANGRMWQISPAWKEFNYIKGDASTPKDIEELRNDIMAYIYDNQLGYKVEEIKAVLYKMAMDGMQDAVIGIMNDIAYDPKCDKSGDNFLKALYDYLKVEESFEIFCVIMKHWAWTVKRKITNQPISDHIWPNFYGAGGLGKTTMLKKLCSPMKDFVSVTNIAKLFDDTKEIKRLTENYILIFDELAVDGQDVDSKLTKDQMALLKSIATGDKLDARIYGSQNQAKRRITFSSISSANYHLADIIYDEQTMRRWFEFHCSGKRPESFDAINRYLDNSVYFWKSIDETKEGGYWNPKDDGIGSEITKIQETYYPTITTTSMWIEAKGVRAGHKSIEEAYSEYKYWCKSSGNCPKALQNFARDIRHMIPDAVDDRQYIFLDWNSDTMDEPIRRGHVCNDFNDFDALGLTA